ncbi:hypothetical protein [Streptomyces sp. BE133]|uniref:hypothetical protein n=1 Tax=Streptomyces sp. BE133 TaxID=3002523 RepID=UPI002E78EE6D|nr:hypothetical protein [Streptomyces sp. BE133]MEE1812662.1 hypothetical protein [Streptomyces sp. BE133]
MNARENLQAMVRTDRGNMTVWSPNEVSNAIDAYRAEVLDELTPELVSLRAEVAEMKAQRERRRVRLIALQNDALDMRGSLSPNGEARKVPFPLGETLTPAVDWLIARVAELERPATEAERNALRQSFMELSAQAREDHDYEGAFNVECDLRKREEQWKREDEAGTSTS